MSKAEGDVASEQKQPGLLCNWRIVRLRLDATGSAWLAAGIRGECLSVITVPECGADEDRDSWLDRVEAEFERGVKIRIGSGFR